MTLTEYSDLLEEYSAEMTTGSSLVVACIDLTRLDVIRLMSVPVSMKMRADRCLTPDETLACALIPSVFDLSPIWTHRML